jgi:uncharacterized protein (TIGR03083 family)
MTAMGAPLDVTGLFPELSIELVALLSGLEAEAWAAPTSCPGWSVHGVACHLLGVEVGNLAVRRDGWKPDRGPVGDGGLDVWNEAWVASCARMSPAVLVDLLARTADAFASHVATLDLSAVGGPVGWATGDAPAPVWLDVGREYMERCVHQQQIREASGRPALPPRLIAPVLATAVHALPRALAGHDRPRGTAVVFRAEGAGGGSWTVTRRGDGWSLTTGAATDPACEVRTSAEGARQRFVRDARAPEPEVTGDPELGAAVAGAKAILGG